jgi:amino acid transporter
VAADHFWPIFVKQQMIEGIYTACSWIIGILIAGVMLFMAIRNIKLVDKEDNKTAIPLTIIGFVCFAVLALVCLISACSVGQEVISKIFNPEYHAVQSLIKMVK